jgi:predicted NAD/FAD-dependent oxidoreductase
MSKDQVDYKPECIVVGAGISGLMAAKTLSNNGVKVLVLDKGRRTGGRMATRQIESCRFDYGAQSVCFTDTGLNDMLNMWLEDGVAKRCAYPTLDGVSDMECGPVCGVNGIRSIPELLARDLNVKTSCRVSRIRRSEHSWLIDAEMLDSAEIITFESDGLIFTPPMPQTRALLKLSGINLPSDVSAHLSEIEYEPCICVMAIYDTSQALLPSGFAITDNSTIALIVDNFSKGVSFEPGAITINTTPEFSQDHWDTGDSDILEQVLRVVREQLPDEPHMTRVHRWRYSRTIKSHPARFKLCEKPGLLVLAGDGFSGTDIEGAALSGLAAAEATLSKLR